jgi:ferrous iron transport protein B
VNVKQVILGVFGLGSSGRSCHGQATFQGGDSLKKIAIVGNPNVGKSVIFNRLTGTYVTVSNYPGTTVDVSRGKARISDEKVVVIDTPGMYSLLPITEEERVARILLLEEKPQIVLHVVDAKNLERMLPFTLQLIEAGLPVMLDLNMMDEAEAAGIKVDIGKLEQELSIPVVATVAPTGRGIEDLVRRLMEYARRLECPVSI